MRKFCYVLVVIISLFMIFLTYNYFFIYHYELVGNKEMNVDVNSDFKDPGIIIKYRGKLIKDYNVIKDLDMSKLGSYLIKYKKGKVNVIRKVNVKDLTGPVGISQMITQTANFANYIYLLAVISVSLGVTNLLPFPALTL